MGDSAEQNGSYKMALTTAKRDLVLKKQRACLYNSRIETYDIIPVVRSAWGNSFGRVSYNCKAIAARGWNPLTRNLLDHPEIAATEEQESTEEIEQSYGSNVAATLNYSNGLVNTCITDIIQHIDLENVREQIRSSQEEGRVAMTTLAESKRLSAGNLFKSGQVLLGPEVLQLQIDRKMAKDNQERLRDEKREGEMRKKRDAYNKAWGEVAHLDITLWTKDQLKSLVSYKKTKADKWRLPTTVPGLREKWELIKNRQPEDNMLEAEARETVYDDIEEEEV